jgi:hypothetical protein
MVYSKSKYLQEDFVMTQELSILVREALKNSRENGYEPFDMSLEALTTDLMLCDADIEKFDQSEVLAELLAQSLEKFMNDSIKQATGQELLDFAARVRSEGILAMVDIITVDREIPGYEKQSKERIASLKEIVADSLEFIGKYKVSRNA